MYPHPDSTVVDRQSGSSLSANADDAAAMLVRAVKRYGSGKSAVVALDDVTIAFPAGKFARPQVVFADEPTGNLDTRSGQEILGFLRSAVDLHHQSIVVVTHDPNAAAWADHVVFVVDGRVHDVMDRPSADSVLDVVKGLGR